MVEIRSPFVWKIDNGIIEIKPIELPLKGSQYADYKVETGCNSMIINHPVLVVMNAESRKNNDKTEYCRLISHVRTKPIAFVASTVFSAPLVNFLLKFFKPKIAAKLFTSDNKARIWLLEQVVSN